MRMPSSLLLVLLLAALGLESLAAQAISLPPGTMLLPESALPEYEKDIDHAGIIRSWDKDKGASDRGREIYQMICHNCHGDVALPGSIPNSLPFATGEFQHGNDPYTMYQTLTRGWRLMVPQVQLVPREKYDVIRYIRQHFLAEHNRDQLFEITDDYLTGLPTGKSTGPVPVKREPWKEMDYGPFLIGTFDMGTETKDDPPPPAPEKGKKKNKKEQRPADYVAPDANIAYKAIAIRLDEGENHAGGVSAGHAWVAFEHDTLRLAGMWTGDGFIDWHGINFDGRHVVRPRISGELQFETGDVPGYANPANPKAPDARIRGLDNRPYGPLPRQWGQYKGLYKHGSRTVISYTVGEAAILESYDLQETDDGVPVLVRTLNIGPSKHELQLRLPDGGAAVALAADNGTSSTTMDSRERLVLPPREKAITLALYVARSGTTGLDVLAKQAGAPLDLTPFTQGGPAQWPNPIETVLIRGGDGGPFAWDSFSLPVANPWKSRLRASGLDFLPGGKAAIVCCWDGDVWRVDGIDGDGPTIRWRRIASGLFQPLGVKIVDGEIFISCRDQIVRLHDLNGDGETDLYECFNSDHQVTEHFHEFAMGLQADEDGNLYYAKSARHARPPLVPHHGTLLKVSADGRETTILANGFRAANGVCRNPDGSFIVTDQEGHWNPMNRINWVTPGGFYGNMWSYGAPEDDSDGAMEQPLCWVDKGFDRSPAELLWVDSKSWGSLDGALLNLSYGQGRIEIVPHERIQHPGAHRLAPKVQGGLCRLPIPDLPTGTMRGRFHPDGHLYLCGMSAWGTAQMDQPGGFYRIRRTGKPAHLPIGLSTRKDGVVITFSDPIDRASAQDVDRYKVQTWALARSANYGSKHYDQKPLAVTQAGVSEDGRTLTLTIPDIAPVWQMEIACDLNGADGETIERVIQSTIHVLP